MRQALAAMSKLENIHITEAFESQRLKTFMDYCALGLHLPKYLLNNGWALQER